MRLTCPTCEATYDAPAGLIPGDGRHVQCSACHTRWFVRAESAPQPGSEAEILRRLEDRRDRPHLRAVPPAPAPAPASDAKTAETEGGAEPAGDFRWEGPAGAPAAAPAPEPPPAPAPPRDTADPAAPEPPAVPRPQPLPLGAAPPASGQASAAIATARPTRLDLTAAAAGPADVAPPARARPRHWALVIAAVAILVILAWLVAGGIGAGGRS